MRCQLLPPSLANIHTCRELLGRDHVVMTPTKAVIVEVDTEADFKALRDLLWDNDHSTIAKLD